MWNIWIEQQLLQANEHIPLVQRETESTKDLLKEATNLRVLHQWDDLLPEAACRFLARCISLPLRLLAIKSLVPTSALSLLAVLPLLSLLQDQVIKLFSDIDWQYTSSTTSLSNPLLVRMARLFEISSLRFDIKQSHLLGINSFLSKEYAKSAQKLGNVAVTCASSFSCMHLLISQLSLQSRSPRSS